MRPPGLSWAVHGCEVAVTCGAAADRRNARSAHLIHQGPRDPRRSRPHVDRIVRSTLGEAVEPIHGCSTGRVDDSHPRRLQRTYPTAAHVPTPACPHSAPWSSRSSTPPALGCARFLQRDPPPRPGLRGRISADGATDAVVVEEIVGAYHAGHCQSQVPGAAAHVKGACPRHEVRRKMLQRVRVHVWRTDRRCESDRLRGILVRTVIDEYAPVDRLHGRNHRRRLSPHRTCRSRRS